MRRRKVLTAATVAAGLVVGAGVWAIMPNASAGTGAPVGALDPYYPDDGNPGYDVQHYDVHITYDPAKPDQFAGDTTVTAVATADLPRFNLDLYGFVVTAVEVDGMSAGSAREGAHELVVNPAHPVTSGSRFTVRVRYSGEPTGPGWSPTHSGGAVAMGEPHSAAAWYPANEHPSDKATFDLTATVPTGWTALGNGLPGPTDTADGSTTFRWHEDKPMATYLSTVAIDKFTVRRSTLPDGLPAIYAYPPGYEIEPAQEQLQVRIHRWLTDLYGPYPFSTTGVTVVSSPTRPGLSFALETQGRFSTQGGLFDAPMTHEMAHQWWGDNVSFTDWRDGCIAECFAEYTTQLWYEHDEHADLDAYYYKSMLEEAESDPDFWQLPIYDAGVGHELGHHIYDRGAMMLHALRRMVGDDAFFGTLRRWQADHRYGNASWPQFEQLAAQVSGKDLTSFFKEWAHSTTKPSPANLYPGTLSQLAPR